MGLPTSLSKLQNETKKNYTPFDQKFLLYETNQIHVFSKYYIFFAHWSRCKSKLYHILIKRENIDPREMYKVI